MRTIEPMAGDHIRSAATAAVKLADKTGDSVSFTFNGTDVIVSPGETPDSVVSRWDHDREAAAKAYRESPEGKAAARAEAVRRAEEDRKTAQNTKRGEKLGVGKDFDLLPAPFKVKRIEGIGNREIDDPSPWEKYVKANKDAYGRATLLYAARWMVFMEDEMSRGKTLAQAAKATEYDADLDGISGAMQGMASNVVAQCWAHGEAFEKWRWPNG